MKKLFWKGARRHDNLNPVQEQSGQIKWVVLDAMGVIYRHGDDVTALVIPFLRSRGCELPDDIIVRRMKHPPISRNMQVLTAELRLASPQAHKVQGR